MVKRAGVAAVWLAARPGAGWVTCFGGEAWPAAGLVTGRFRDPIHASVEDAVERARSRLPHRESLLECEDCGAEIPVGRRKALRGVRLCVDGQSERDRRYTTYTGYDRRGSKDSQQWCGRPSVPRRTPGKSGHGRARASKPSDGRRRWAGRFSISAICVLSPRSLRAGYVAGRSESRGSGFSSMGMCTTAANTPKKTPAHHIMSYEPVRS